MKSCLLLIVLGFVGMAGFSHAAPLNMSMVEVAAGQTANPADPDTGGLYGSVAYDYYIGTYEVTNSQYTTFLNAVATDATGPSYLTSLYNSGMVTNQHSNPIAGITRTEDGNTYTYAVVSGTGSQPVASVSWFSAARFSNWMDTDGTSTESGAYTMSAGSVTQVSRSSNVATLTSADNTLSVGDQVTVSGTSGYDGTHTVTAVTATTFSFAQSGSNQAATGASGSMTGVTATRNAGATWWLPSEDEWYKAAYYNETTDGYYLYPTGSDTTPGNQNQTGSNEANLFDGDYTTSPPGVTEVGYFENTTSPYGAYDMGGNLWEWNEAIIDVTDRGVRGGAWDTNPSSLESSNRGQLTPVNSLYNDSDVGFRLAASIPEPGSALLVLAGGTLLLFTRSRRKSHG